MALYDVSTSEKKASPELVAGGTLYGSMPLASLVFFSGDTDKIPTGFCIADGRALSRTTYASLFAILGTTWGSGDGSTTFNIPDLSGKTAMGVETGHALGASENGALPNIKSANQNSVLSWASGTEIKPDSAIYSGGAGYTGGTTVGGAGAWNHIRMDASRSNSIYTDGQTKVDPANVRAYWIIKISEVAVPADFLAKVDEAVEDVYGDIIPSDASASNKLVTKSDINTVTSGTATNTANVTSGNCTWIKKGSVVVVTLNSFTPVTYTGGDRQLATGLPKPIAYTAWGLNSVDGSKNQLFSIGTDGILMGASGSMQGGVPYYQTMTYLTND